MQKIWLLINTSIGRTYKKLDVPNFFTENGVIFDNYMERAHGFNDFFINIGQKLQQKWPKPTKSLKDFLGFKVPSNFVFNFIDDLDIIEACAKLKPKTSQGIDVLSKK